MIPSMSVPVYNKVHGEKSVDDVITKFQDLAKNRVLKSEDDWE